MDVGARNGARRRALAQVVIDRAYLTLALVPGIGRARLDNLMTSCGSAAAVLRASASRLATVPGVSRALATAITDSSARQTDRLVASVERVGGVILVPTDARFPATLREIPEAPTVLFVIGAVDLLHREAVAVVGSRTHTRYGAEVTRHFASGLARAGLVIVSGMARGLDAVAHTAALDVGGATVGALGNGLGVVYPAANRKLYERVAAEGCLLTEHPPGEKPHAGSFPRRNRLISGLARATVVTEARRQSGALITADCALSQGREVLAVPGPITSPLSAGCNALIHQGAKPALGLGDVLDEYGLSPSAPAVGPLENLSRPERRVMDALGLGLDHVDEIAHQVGESMGDVLAALTSLEVRGLVTQHPGKVFRRAVG